MYSKSIKKSKLKNSNRKKLLLSSLIAVGILSPLDLISQPIIRPKINSINKYSTESFITKAVEMTGPSVVTIETERYVAKRQMPRGSQIFLDP